MHHNKFSLLISLLHIKVTPIPLSKFWLLLHSLARPIVWGWSFYLDLQGTGAAEYLAHNEHVMGSISQIAQCGPSIPNCPNTGYYQGTLILKDDCSLLSHYFRDWLLPIILFGNIFLLYLSFPCVFCMSFSDTVISVLTRNWNGWKRAPGWAWDTLPNCRLWSHCCRSWLYKHRLFPRYFTSENELLTLQKHYQGTDCSLRDSHISFFLNIYLAICFLPELFWYDEFKHYTAILMKWFRNFADQGIPLHGQQEVISPWPQNPQDLMDFGYPFEVMQITKTPFFFLAYPLLPGYFAHIPGRLGITFYSRWQWTSTCMRTQVHRPLLNSTLGRITTLNLDQPALLLHRHGWSMIRDPAALDIHDQVTPTTSSKHRSPGKYFLVVWTVCCGTSMFVCHVHSHCLYQLAWCTDVCFFVFGCSQL